MSKIKKKLFNKNCKIYSKTCEILIKKLDLTFKTRRTEGAKLAPRDIKYAVISMHFDLNEIPFVTFHYFLFLKDM